MFLPSLLSGLLLLFPIVVTVGVYIGVEFQKIFNGGFKGSYGVPGSGGLGGSPASPSGDKVATNMYCQKLFGITPKGSRYIYNPNQWGLGDDEVSRMCMNITTGTIKEGSGIADPFSVTWNYTQGPESQPVRAFPNALLKAPNLPIQISNIKSIPVDVNWFYNLGNSNRTQTDDATLESNQVNANVAFDMFLATDKSNSQVTEKADHEVMVWLGAIGPATQPIGLQQGAIATKVINGTTFNLYTGKNGFGQNVWTWLTPTTTNRFVGDVLELITDAQMRARSGPTDNDYLGYMGFGTEAYSAPTNVTFTVPELSIDIQ